MELPVGISCLLGSYWVSFLSRNLVALACSAGVFSGGANVFARKSAILKLPQRGGNGAALTPRPVYYFYSSQPSSVIKSVISIWLFQIQFRFGTMLIPILEYDQR